MANEFKFLDFYTKYSSTGDKEHQMSQNGDACFSDIFYIHKTEPICNWYEIIIFTTTEKLKHGKNNYCLLDIETIKKHIRNLRKYVKFNVRYKIKRDHISLLIKLDGYLIEHKFLLSYIRYLYEYPFNVILNDVYSLSKEKVFSNISIINLFNLFGTSTGINVHGTGVHAIGALYNWKEFITTKDIISYFNKNHCGTLNEIFIKFEPICEYINDRIKDANIQSLDFWTNPEYLNIRKEIYIKNLKSIINEQF